MKKLAFLLLLIPSSALANVVTIDTVSNDNIVTTINSNFSRLSTLQGGNIEGSCDGGTSVCNVKADSIFRINMADDADPATFAKETLQITVDTTSSEGSYSYSGCIPADDTDLTSDISACVSYINGIRVSKSATSNTYTANRDCYVDLSQTGVYTTTCVANGASEPAVASNSGRMAKVVTNGTEITSITDMRNTRLPGLLVPSHYRTGMFVSRDSATTIAVLPGTIEINNTMVNKTATTTLTISTAGDWAGGSSLQDANTTGYVGIDASGNLKLHTTAPTHDNYGVSTTAGKKRYATWSSTVYRILGWFRMNSASQINSSDWGNIKEGDVSNTTISNDSNVVAFTTTSFTNAMEINYYSSGGQITLLSAISGDVGAAFDSLETRYTMDGNTLDGSGQANGRDAASTGTIQTVNPFVHTPSQGAHTYRVQTKNQDGDAFNFRKRSFIIRED